MAEISIKVADISLSLADLNLSQADILICYLPQPPALN